MTFSKFVLVILTLTIWQSEAQIFSPSYGFDCSTQVMIKRSRENFLCQQKVLEIPNFDLCQKLELTEKCDLAYGDCFDSKKLEKVKRFNRYEMLKFFDDSLLSVLLADCPFIKDFKPKMDAIFEPTLKCNSDQVKKTMDSLEECITEKTGIDPAQTLLLTLASEHYLTPHMSSIRYGNPGATTRTIRAMCDVKLSCL